MKTRVKAIVVRDEYLIKSDTSGTLSLLVDEGEKVQKLQRVATIYNKNVDNSTEREIYNLKEESESKFEELLQRVLWHSRTGRRSAAERRRLESSLSLDRDKI